jgi:hypothetical protein
LPNEAEAINLLIATVTGLAGGWYTRKFKEKKYGKAEV